MKNNPYIEIETDIILDNNFFIHELISFTDDGAGVISKVKLKEIMRMCFEEGYKSASEVQNNNKQF